MYGVSAAVAMFAVSMVHCGQQILALHMLPDGCQPCAICNLSASNAGAACFQLLDCCHTTPAAAAAAVWLREGLVRLGPTFIKIGQQFSTRVDVLSPEFVKELEKLQVKCTD
jgi:hypothetical protein